MDNEKNSLEKNSINHDESTDIAGKLVRNTPSLMMSLWITTEI